MGRFTVEGDKLVADGRVQYHAIPVAHKPNHFGEGRDYHAWMIPTESGHDLQVQGVGHKGRIAEDTLTGVVRNGTGERNLSDQQFKSLRGGQDSSLVIMKTPEELHHYTAQVSRMGGAGQMRSVR